MSSLLEQASLVVTPNGTKASKLYSVKPTDGSGDMTVVRATTATRVNSSGLIESSAVNVPRLDYTGSTCPSLLVEPQRTNLVTYSEQFDDASWSKNNGTITANATISPSGVLNAEEWAGNGANMSHDFSKGFTGGSTTTSSIYVKKNTAQFVYISLNYSATGSDWGTGVYDLDNLTTAVNRSGGVTNPVATITDAGNGWRRIVLSISTASTSLFTHFGISNSLSPTFTARGRVDYATSASFYAWGAQLEAGSNATSYIPTTSATVTRNADLISKTGITDLIGQTEGTIFAEVNFTASNLNDRTIVNLSDNTTANWIFIRTSATVPNGIRFRIANGGALQFDYNSSAISTGVHKLCLSYKLNNISAYIDGVKVSSSTTATIPATSKINIGCTHDNLLQFNDRIKSALLFKTQLTDQECINLTTI